MSKITDLEDNDAFAVNSAAVAAGLKSTVGSKVVFDWSIDEVVHWLVSTGFDDVAEVFGAHGVSGNVLPKITQSALKEMGIQSIGRRVQLHNEIEKVQTVARAEWRRGIVWSNDEYRRPNCRFV